MPKKTLYVRRKRFKPDPCDPAVFPILKGQIMPPRTGRTPRAEVRSDEEARLYDAMITRGFGIGGKSIKYPLKFMEVGDMLMTPRAFTRQARMFVENYNYRHSETQFALRTLENFVGIWRSQ